MRRYNRYRPRRRKRVWPWLVLILLVVAGAVWGATKYLPQFERIPPEIIAPKSAFWSQEIPIKVILKDNRGLQEYRVILTNGQETIPIVSNMFMIPLRRSEIILRMPKGVEKKIAQGAWRLVIQVKDTSVIHRFLGSSTITSVQIEADTLPPMVKLLAKSTTMAQGGSALVIFKVKDVNLKNVYVVAGGRKFVPQVYRRKPYYATLIAWPFRQKQLNAAVVALDYAGNKTVKKFGFPVVYKPFKVSWIHASDHFINGRITYVAKTDPRFAHIKAPLDRFRAVNETMRLDNEKKIHKLASVGNKKTITRWKVHPFYPLKSAKLVAEFGDERHYYYDNPKKEISHSYHVGYDLASVRHAPIIASNSGTVRHAAKNGIYGNMPLIDHGFGLATLYGHCSQILVHDGDKVTAGQMIARTGKTGLALGDHLHFGVLVHGIEVWPMDWMKQNWIHENIDQVFEKADKIMANAKQKLQI